MTHQRATESSEAPALLEEPRPSSPIIDMSDAYVRVESLGELFALSLASVREVVGSSPVSRIPRAPRAAVGLMNHAGRVYTIIDLAALLLDEAGEPREQVVLVDDPTRLLGLAVDRVVGISPLEVHGDIARFEERAVSVIDIDSLIREIDSSFESSSVLVSAKLARSSKEF